MDKITRELINNMIVVFVNYLKDQKVELEKQGYIPTIDLVIEKLEEIQTNTNPVD